MSYAEQCPLIGCQVIALNLKLPIKERISAVRVLVKDHLPDIMEQTSRVSQVWVRLAGKFCQLAADARCPHGMVKDASLTERISLPCMGDKVLQRK